MWCSGNQGLILSLQLLLGIFWGIGENRVYGEKGDIIVARHFKAYHIWMFIIFLLTMFTSNILLWIWRMIWSFLILDIVWWLIRYYDFKTNYDHAVQEYNGETNAWHECTDWDNYGHYPLVLNCYWWWWLFTGILIILGTMLV